VRVLAAVIAFTFTCGIGLVHAGPNVLRGTFALQGGTPRVQATLDAVPDRDPRATRLDLWESTPGSTRPLRAYDTGMTKKLHLIAVSDDLTTFLHEHPAPGADGHFRLNLRVPKPALYHLYADAEPHGYGQQVFRFDLPIGAAARPVPRRLAATPASMTVGPYTVSFDSLMLDTGHRTTLVAHVRKQSAPAQDLHPYLGAMAHAVFVNARDLTYVHTHPMELSAMAKMQSMPSNGMGAMESEPALAPGAKVAPDMMLHVTAREPGTYKLWLQFRGGSQLYVAPFVLHTR
jgi:hypothetical protein